MGQKPAFLAQGKHAVWEIGQLHAPRGRSRTLDDLEGQRRTKRLPRDSAPQSIFIFQDTLAGPRG